MSRNFAKSERSDTPVLIRFVNKTNRLITVIWIGFNGGFFHCRDLEHDQFVDINTFTTHPWIFVDPETGDLMHVNHKDIYYPQPVICPRTRRTERTRVYIHFPLYTLKTYALLRVRNIMKTLRFVHLLEIPETLKRDLQRAFHDRLGRSRYFLPEPNDKSE